MKKLYVDYDEQGNIIGLFKAEQYANQPMINANHAKVKAYQGRTNVVPSIEEKKIQKEMRDLAIDSLKDKGELPPDYEDNKGKK